MKKIRYVLGAMCFSCLFLGCSGSDEQVFPGGDFEADRQALEEMGWSFIGEPEGEVMSGFFTGSDEALSGERSLVLTAGSRFSDSGPFVQYISPALTEIPVAYIDDDGGIIDKSGNSLVRQDDDAGARDWDLVRVSFTVKYVRGSGEYYGPDKLDIKGRVTRSFDFDEKDSGKTFKLHVDIPPSLVDSGDDGIKFSMSCRRREFELYTEVSNDLFKRDRDDVNSQSRFIIDSISFRTFPLKEFRLKQGPVLLDTAYGDHPANSGWKMEAHGPADRYIAKVDGSSLRFELPSSGMGYIDVSREEFFRIEDDISYQLKFKIKVDGASSSSLLFVYAPQSMYSIDLKEIASGKFVEKKARVKSLHKYNVDDIGHFRLSFQLSSWSGEQESDRNPSLSEFLASLSDDNLKVWIKDVELEAVPVDE